MVRGRVDIVPVALDNASVPIIGRHAATGRIARLRSDGSSVGCGQGRKGGAENDCSGKCDLCHIGHCPILRLLCVWCSGTSRMAREIPESEVATMEALVKCGVVMVSIALVYAIRRGAIQRCDYGAGCRCRGRN